MNLEQVVRSSLWENIKNNYESQDYSGAILDTIHHLSEIIRERSELQSDGAALVGQAFGGKRPILRINKLQSQSERNEQAGLEQLIRGIYQGIRNPRSHEKYTDSKETADSIIAFIDYLISIIDKSKSPFNASDYLRRVFDDSFVEDNHYAEILVKQIPAKRRMDIFVEVFRRKESGNCAKVRYFVVALLKKLSKEEKKEVFRIVSDELKETSNTSSIRSIIQMMPGDSWPKYEEASRMRCEGILIKSIKEGKFDIHENKCSAGALGTWTSSICDHVVMKNKLAAALINKLESSDMAEQDYVFNYLFYMLYVAATPPSTRLQHIIIRGLKSGDERYYNNMSHIMSVSEEWKRLFGTHYDSFVLKEQGEEVPF